MKQSPETRRIAERMAPGALSRDGFLGADRRPLDEIIAADASAVVALGTSHEELAARLEDAYNRARAALGRPVRLGEGLTAVWTETMGRIPCPWGEGTTAPKGQVEVADEAAGEALVFTALSIHLIAAHGFYQGRGSPYRLEPAAIHRTLQTAR